MTSPNILSSSRNAYPCATPITTLLSTTTAPAYQYELYSTASTGSGITTAVPSSYVGLTPLPLVSPALPQVTVTDVKELKSIGGRSILNVEMFTKAQLHALFNLAQAFRIAVYKDRCLDGVLRVNKKCSRFLCRMKT